MSVGIVAFRAWRFPHLHRVYRANDVAHDRHFSGGGPMISKGTPDDHSQKRTPIGAIMITLIARQVLSQVGESAHDHSHVVDQLAV